MRALALGLLLAASTSSAATHCLASETVAFSCAVGGARVVSLCLTRSTSDRAAQLAYRFGRPGAPELVFPDTAPGSTQQFRYAHYFRAQVDRTEVSFSSGGADYTVFDYYEGEGKPSRIRGVRVAVKGRDRPLLCRAEVVSRLPQLEALVPCDAENALGSCR